MGQCMNSELRKTAEQIADQIMADADNKCQVCRKNTAVTVHEIVPKSLRPRDWWVYENRIAVCNECHETIHREGTRKWKQRLLQAKAS